jgi:hypothetical protein
MRASVLKAAGSIVALTLAVAAAIGPATADGSAQRYGCLRVGYGGWYGWDMLGDDGGAALVRSALGKYPYTEHGYNSGACIGYRTICDPSGNVIGRRPIMTC